MTRRDDAELEAMAARLEMYSFVSCKKAAAMLRACKTGDAPDHAVWNAALELAAAIPRAPVVQERIRALKKGPDHDT